MLKILFGHKIHLVALLRPGAWEFASGGLVSKLNTAYCLQATRMYLRRLRRLAGSANTARLSDELHHRARFLALKSPRAVNLEEKR